MNDQRKKNRSYRWKKDLGDVRLTQPTTATDAERDSRTTTEREIIRGDADPGAND